MRTGYTIFPLRLLKNCRTLYYMSTTLTIRAAEALREALAKRAKHQGKNVSEVIREILQAALDERPLEARVGQLKGRLRLPRKPAEPWRARLRKQNWRS